MDYAKKETLFYDPDGMTTVPNHIEFESPVNLGDNIWILDNVISQQFCEKVISTFEKNKESQRDGVTGMGMNKEVKDSKDLHVSEIQEEKEQIDSVFYKSLHTGTGKIVHELMNHPCPIGWSPDSLFHHDTGYQLQKTLPGGRYIWHIENAQSASCFKFGSAARTLTYIIYLNDVPEDHGGSTGFLYQKLKVQPKAGRLVLFPPYWTHVHSGYPLEKGEKYIMTGWFFSEAHNGQ
jgi:hypothetical protein